MDKQTCKFVARVAENLPMMSSDIMQGWIDNPRGLQKFLSGLVPSVEETKNFPIYLECEVGGKSKDELITEIELNGMFASDWAKDIMGKPAWKPGEKQTVKFARVKVCDLGFTKNPGTSQIWARIQEFGHSLCESGDGPAIRLVLKDQPRNDRFWIAMEQIAASGGLSSVFIVERRDDSGSRLVADWVGPRGERYLDNEFVFRLRK